MQVILILSFVSSGVQKGVDNSRLQETGYSYIFGIFSVSHSTGIFSCKQVDCVKEKQEDILYNGKISSETSSRNLHILFKTPDFFKLGMAWQTIHG